MKPVTVKAIWNREYTVLMIKKDNGDYSLSVARTTDREPTIYFDTPDYKYADQLFDKILENLETF
jgi:hypothetical protein